MQSEEIRKRFLAFFEKRGHAIIPGASLVPENDPSVLFTTAGMQSLVPYLLGEKHPAGKRLASVQKCVRTHDIEEVGDNTHDTFFEMLGNWSLGDYFKDDAIAWSYEFLTSKEEGLGLDPKRLYITVFAGDENAPKDVDAFELWKKYVPERRIYFLGADANWWSPGDSGPCGPDTEMFYDVTGILGDLTEEEFKAADNAQHVVEIWNDVFMEYEKKNGSVVGALVQRNVDTGAGLERLAMVLQRKDNIFETDLFAPLMEIIHSKARRSDTRAERVVADHIRTATFIIADGVVPSNTDRGYIARRLIRRAVRFADTLGLAINDTRALVDAVIQKYGAVYPNLVREQGKIVQEIGKEEKKFRATLKDGLKAFEKGEDPFMLYQSYGFPIEMTVELAREKGITVDLEKFNKALEEHKTLSRVGAEKKFKGGLAGHGEKEIQYHTATHLLHQALRAVLGPEAVQKGSNITPERLRFDFSFPRKMTDEEKRAVEDMVNKKIQEALPVSWSEMTVFEAREKGAVGLFDEQYGEKVKVYQIGDTATGIFSLEFCGGPHVANTSELKGRFLIVKEEAVSVGVRRIKAELR